MFVGAVSSKLLHGSSPFGARSSKYRPPMSMDHSFRPGPMRRDARPWAARVEWTSTVPIVQFVRRGAPNTARFFAGERGDRTYIDGMEAPRLTIDDFMTTAPCSVHADLSLADAQERMAFNNIRHLLVERDGRMVGLLSARDIGLAATLATIDPHQVSVARAMRENVYTCHPDDAIEDVAHEMEAHRLGCAVVIESDVVVGIFTTTDALRALRQVLRGQPVERAVTPTHVVEANPRSRNLTRQPFRVADALRSRGAAPSAKMGMLGNLGGL